MSMQSGNRGAFLDMIAYAEGTSRVPDSDDGYRVIVGGSTFNDYADHPRKLVTVRPNLKSTAAGRYQLLERYWDAYRKILELKDFSPQSQDSVAIRQIAERKALQDVDAGRISVAIAKVKNIWASLPGAGYGQPEKNIDALLMAFKRSGGMLVA